MKTMLLFVLLLIGISAKAQSEKSIDNLNDAFWKCYTSDLPKAHRLCDQAIVGAKKLNYRKGLGVALYQKGVAYDIALQADSARVFLLRGIYELKQTKDVASLASAYNNLGIHYYYQYDYSKAIQMYQEAKRNYERAGLLDDVAGAYNNIGICQKNRGDFKGALRSYKDALKLAKKKKDTEVIASTLLNIASVFHAQRNWIAAKATIESAAPYIQQGTQLEINYCFSSGEIAIGLKDFKYGERVLLKGLQLSKVQNNKEREQYFYEALARLYRTVGKYEEAFTYMQRYDSLRDLNYSEQSSQFLAEYEQKFKLKEKEELLAKKELNLLREKESRRKLKEQFEANARALSIALVSIGFLVFIVVLALWAYRLKRKSEALSRLLVEEKNLLAKEMHHRVKNNLQIVASMVAIQGRTMGDKEQAKLESVVQAIQSMAKIHTTLYDGSSWEWVEMPELVRVLSEQFEHVGNNQLQFVKCVSALSVDLDTAIAIGLILNELMTNSMKYAFESIDHPTISITIQQNDAVLSLHYADNGCGFNDDNAVGTQFGSKMLTSMLKKVKGELRQYTNGGAHTEIRILRFKTR